MEINLNVPSLSYKAVYPYTIATCNRCVKSSKNQICMG